MKADNTYNKKEILELCRIEGLTIDLTDVSQEIKNEITEIKGNLRDYSKETSYKKLKSVHGNADFETLINAEGLSALTQIHGNAYF
jgi:hypothetical protein